MKARFLRLLSGQAYGPLVGRFLQPDRACPERSRRVPDPKNPHALNRYSYVYNNPLRYTDPTGHCLVEVKRQRVRVPVNIGNTYFGLVRVSAPLPAYHLTVVTTDPVTGLQWAYRGGPSGPGVGRLVVESARWHRFHVDFEEGQRGAEVYDGGSEESCVEIDEALNEATKDINDAERPYQAVPEWMPGTGYNSNSAARWYAAIVAQVVQGADADAHPGGWTPGYDEWIFPPPGMPSTGVPCQVDCIAARWADLFGPGVYNCYLDWGDCPDLISAEGLSDGS